MKMKSFTEPVKRILIIQTGGTIGSKPYIYADKPPKIVETIEQREGNKLFSSFIDGYNADIFDWNIIKDKDFYNKDSKLFNQKDIDRLVDIVATNGEYNHTIITHGTDNMANNAALFKNAFKQYDEYNHNVVAFAGAMVPLSMHNKTQINGNYIPSDGFSSLVYTVNNIKNQCPGVHLVARDDHTRRLNFFDPEIVEKNWLKSKESLEFTVKTR
jgi:hypothetical protein